jgi:hypothetical protein
VTYERIDVNIFTGGDIDGLLIRDHHSDTLIYSKKVHFKLWKNLSSLLGKELSISSVKLDASLLKVKQYRGERDNSLDVFVSHFEKPKKEKRTPVKPFNLDIDQLEFTDFTLFLELMESGLTERFHIASGSTEIGTLQFPANYFYFRKANLNKPEVTIVKDPKVTQTTTPKAPKRDTSQYYCRNPFILFFDELQIEGGSLNFDKTGSTEFIADGLGYIDYKHFFVRDFSASLRNFRYEDLTAQASIQHLALKVNDHFSVKQFISNKISVSDQALRLEGMELLTEKSEIRDSLILQYDSYRDFLDFNNNIFILHTGKDCNIHSTDIGFFFKSIKQNAFFKNNPELRIRYTGELAGKVNSLKAYGLKASLDDKIYFDGSASTRNLGRRGKEFLNLRINQLTTSISKLQRLIPQIKSNPSLEKLGDVNFKGEFTGYFDDFVSYGTFQTALGQLRSDVKLNIRSGTDKAAYSGDIDLKEFNLGQLFNQKQLGNITLKAYIKNGIGLKKSTAHADLNANILAVEYNGYSYKNINFIGKLSPDLMNGSLTIKEENIDLDFKGSMTNLQTTPNIDFTANIRKADLKELNLTKQGMIVSTVVNSNFRNINIDQIDGDIRLSKTLLYDYEKNRVLTLGDIVLSQFKTNQNLTTRIQSEFLNLDLSGEYKTTAVYNQLISYLYKNHPDIFSQLKISHKSDLQAIRYNGVIEGKSLDRIFHFMNWNVKFDQFNARIFNDSKLDSILIVSDFSAVKYENVHASQLHLEILGNSNKIQIKNYLPDFQIGKKTLIRDLSLNGELKSNEIFLDIQGQDSLLTQKLYDLGLKMSFGKEENLLSFVKRNIILHGRNWMVKEGASLALYNKSFEINNLSIMDSLSSIEFDDKGRQGLKILLVNLDFSILNDLIHTGGLKFEGLFDTRIEINNVYSLNEIYTNTNISNLRINNRSYGRTKLDFALSDPLKPAKINFYNQHKETKIEGKGSINIPLVKNYELPKYDLKLDVDITAFPISFLENFITSIRNTSGSVSGQCVLEYQDKRLTGTGELITDSGASTIDYLNTSYKFNNQKISLEGNLISFNELQLTDELNNPVRVAGKIRHKNFTEYNIDVNVRADKALILNTTKGQNPYFYGYGICSINADFIGPTYKMDMEVSARSLKGSKLVLPVQQDQQVEDTKFVRFVSKDTLQVTQAPTIKRIGGLNMTLNMEVTDDAEISIIFDEKTGDILKGTGRGNLQIQSLRDNTFTIKGSYEIEDGQYLFTLFNFVNKPFRLKRGGTITWTGDPLNADINLEASYEKLNVSPALLIQEFTANDPEIQQAANNRTPVDLVMILRGSLLKPDINFDLNFPDVTGRLKSVLDNKVRILKQNPDQLNQQIAALIAFRTFISTNPGFVTGISNTTINTMSEFLSNQLSIFVSNLLSEAFADVDFISGVDFNINYDVDKSALAQSRLNEGQVVFSVRHRLWNDQWAVTLGGNYRSNSTIYGNTYFNPESVVEWNTPVPGLKMRVYYKSLDSIQGIRHRVGAGISIRKEFDNLFDFKKAIKNQKENKPQG